MMNKQREVVVLSAVRTAVGKYGGSLKDIPPTELAAAVTREAVKRSGLSPNDVCASVFGNVIHTDAKDVYMARVAALGGGLPIESSAITVNRLCGSGLSAILLAAQSIVHGDVDAAVGGGAESMSRSPYWLPNMRWGARMNDAVAVDVMVGVLTDPFEGIHMGITAEQVARKWNISRQAQDELAVESHKRALNAVQSCRFKDQIVPIEIKVKGGTVAFEKDESPRSDASMESLSKLRPVFDKNGTVTAGNSSSVNDGAAALILMDREKAEQRGLKPMAKLVDYAVTGVEPGYMGIGPISAVRAVFKRTGLTVDDIDVFEVNEAFAAQALAVCGVLGFPANKTNPNGSGISIGHPLGATGAIITVKALHELRRIEGRYALVTMCIGGGQGIAAIFEAMN